MNKEFICYMDAQDYRDMQKGTIKWCAVGTKQSENDTDVKLFASLPVKELTDEEIIEQANHLADGWFSDKFEKGIFITEEKLVDLVKAILRKAQEK